MKTKIKKNKNEQKEKIKGFHKKVLSQLKQKVYVKKDKGVNLSPGASLL